MRLLGQVISSPFLIHSLFGFFEIRWFHLVLL